MGERPAWSNGALLLVPMTQQQIIEAGIYLESHNILMLASDEQLVKHALAKLVRRKRPELKPEHYPHGKPARACTDIKSRNVEAQHGSSRECNVIKTTAVTRLRGTQAPDRSDDRMVGAWMQDIGLVTERTFLKFPLDKDVSE